MNNVPLIVSAGHLPAHHADCVGFTSQHGANLRHHAALPLPGPAITSMNNASRIGFPAMNNAASTRSAFPDTWSRATERRNHFQKLAHVASVSPPSAVGLKGNSHSSNNKCRFFVMLPKITCSGIKYPVTESNPGYGLYSPLQANLTSWYRPPI